MWLICWPNSSRYFYINLVYTLFCFFVLLILLIKTTLKIFWIFNSQTYTIECNQIVEAMMKSKVTCHFCNKESSVFIVYKNSWTCQSCNQYNGFNKDGDYNKPIPEMQKESKKTFCLNAPATPKKQVEATNLLCHRCNSSQEQKVSLKTLLIINNLV